tara:strand:- start:651 stop:1166 length:516 start_codon:yes stop_codon:yes gene_type:complete
MAKKGYRGKHPNNDNKVSPNPSKSKYNPKLEKEYRRLKNSKTKNDYIRTHYFYPQSTTTITVNGDVTAGENIVITSTNGTVRTYTAQNAESLADNHFKKNLDNSGSLIDCINNAAGHGGKILAELSSHKNILLTQIEPGPDGNTSVSGSSVNVTASNQAADQISVNGSFSF